MRKMRYTLWVKLVRFSCQGLSISFGQVSIQTLTCFLFCFVLAIGRLDPCVEQKLCSAANLVQWYLDVSLTRTLCAQ